MVVIAYLWLLHLAAWKMLIARLLSFLAVDFDIGIFPILDVLSDGIILDQNRLFRKNGFAETWASLMHEERD